MRRDSTFFRNSAGGGKLSMPRHIKIGLIVLGIGFAVALGFFVNIVGRVQSMMKNDRKPKRIFKAPATAAL